MTRDVLRKILSRAPGAEKTKDSFAISKEHHLTFYLGEPGRAMVVSDIEQVVLDDDDFLEASAREEASTIYIPYDVIQAVALRPPKKESDRRAGFS